MATIRAGAELPASRQEIWDVLADYGSLARWAPGVDHSRLVSAESSGPGAVRRVQLGRLAVLETVLAAEEPGLFSYRIEGLPFTDSAVTTWRLEPAAENTRVEITTVLRPRPGIPGAIAGRLIAARMARFAAQMLEALR